ncbi:MAG: hypothetical protein QOC86_2216 [Gaiellales bacterium]|jgi:hypothetical protein|nr:hypothetical protein [Gaiellales bacterium]
MPSDDTPTVEQPETDTPIEGEDAAKTPHTHPGEDAGGWKAASEASKDDPATPRPGSTGNGR